MWAADMLLTASLLFGLSAGFPQQAAVQSRATAGCGKSHFHFGFTVYRDLKSGTRDRKYSIHLPSNYDRNRAYPTVLGFHGASTNGFLFEVDTQFSESRFSGNKIMVYPNGVDGNWAGPSYANATMEEDLQYVSDVLDDVRNNFCVDEKRIYATGISNGGGFVNDIACSSVGASFAAFAPASGAYYTDTNGPNNGCAPARSPLPLLEIHGGNDQTVKYAGGQGEGGILPSIPDWLGYWAQRSGCTDKTEEDSFGGEVHHLSWTCGGVAGALQHWKIDTMGHCWASTEPNFSQLAVPELPTHVQANDIIMKFFDEHALP